MPLCLEEEQLIVKKEKCATKRARRIFKMASPKPIRVREHMPEEQ